MPPGRSISDSTGKRIEKRGRGSIPGTDGLGGCKGRSIDRNGFEVFIPRPEEPFRETTPVPFSRR